MSMTACRTTMAILAATLAALAAACSGGGDGADSTPPVPTPTVDVFRAPPVAQTIRMSEWKIEGMPELVNGGGVIEFNAVNEGTMIHELSVLKVLDDGGLDFNGQTREIPPGESGDVAILVDPGTYQLACLILPGEAGSTLNHQEQGMVTRFVVE